MSVFDMGRGHREWDKAYPFTTELDSLDPLRCYIYGHSPIVQPTSPPKYVCGKCGMALEPATHSRQIWVQR